MMALGASRNQLIVLGVLVAIALFAFSYLFSGSSAPAAPATATTGSTTAAKPATGNTRAGRRPPPRNTLLPPSRDPALRHDLLALGETYEYGGTKRNIFSSQPEVKIPEVADTSHIVVDHSHDAPPPPPPPPPIPLKFYGFATQTGQAKRVFLSSGDDVFVGTEGQVINKRYRIVKINNNSVEIEDILNHNTQPIPLTSQS
jgi:hypothetical protein